MMASLTTLEKKFEEFKKAKETPQNKYPKIQKVDKYLRNRNDFEKHFSPKWVSIGPIHHDNQNLKLGENYKFIWAAKYIQHIQQSPELLYKKIADKIDELKGLYADDVLANTAESLKGFCSLEEKLSWVLFVDECFLLYFLIAFMNFQLGEPIDVNIKVDQLDLVLKDVLLLENQLPFLVLELLSKNDNVIELIDTLKDFLKGFTRNSPPRKHKMTWRRGSDIEEKLPYELPIVRPTHLLDLLRQTILTKPNLKMKAEASKKAKEEVILDIESMTYRNIQDLRAVGIKLKSSGTRNPGDVNFSEGWFAAELTLPQIFVDNSTAASLLNLIAYEICPDFENNYGICSYVCFMDSLIDHAEDVRILRSKGILVNSLGRDEEVADLFNNISTDLVYYSPTYLEVRDKIHKHHYHKCKIWLALGYNKYFSNPWAITGFIAAVIALVLTFVQTWFSIYPR